jgi:elongator complex protein 3
VAGVKKGNLRQVVREEMNKRGLQCCCIRCREVGHRMLFDGVTPIVENIQIITRRYEASNGVELFISAEDEENDVLIGFIRLRLPSAETHRPEIKILETAIVRELHVYGPLVPIGASVADAWQHRGYGRALIEEAEKASLKNGKSRVVINSALGVREYFRMLGYKRMGHYMGKNLN